MSSHFDTITRSYKNAAGNIIGVTTISLRLDPIATNIIPGNFLTAAQRFHRRVLTSSTFLSLTTLMAESRVVSSIQMYGQYTSFTLNAGSDDFLSVTYSGGPSVNDVVIGFDQFPTIGETI